MGFPIDANTKLLLHCNGTDASTSFPDSASGNKTVTAVGNAQVDTAQFKFGTASGLFDGSGDYLTVPDSADWDFGTGDFTIDFWVRFNSIVNSGFYSNLTAGGTGLFIGLFTDNTLKVYINSTSVATKSETWSPSTNTWYHVACVRSGTNLMLFINGTQIGTPTTDSTNITGSTQVLSIGALESLSLYALNGWIDEYRVSNVARWTSNFTPYVSEYGLSGADKMFLVM